MDNAAEQLMYEYLNEVIAANTRVNLTRITDPDQARILHVEDSLAVLPEVMAAPEGAYADLGSGAGFPGVPLALASRRTVLLVESVKKKVQVVRDIVERLHLEDRVDTYAGRCEDLALQRPGEFALITVRALAPLPSLLELAAPLLKVGGHLVCLKGPDAADEVAWAKRLEGKLGMELVHSRDFALSKGLGERAVYVFEKKAEPRVSLPRRPGAAQNHPYKE